MKYNIGDEVRLIGKSCASSDEKWMQAVFDGKVILTISNIENEWCYFKELGISFATKKNRLEIVKKERRYKWKAINSRFDILDL